MLISLMSPAGVARLTELTHLEWRAAIPRWEETECLVLFDEMRELLTLAVCEWAGVPLPAQDIRKRADDFGGMIEGGSQLVWGYLRGRLGRKRGEAWISDLIEKVRAGEIEVSEDTALHGVTWHREPDGQLLDKRIAAVELLNVLRPTVAVARFITFAALALHEHPHCRRQLETGGDGAPDNFVGEVRRYYPFFPFVAARTRKAFEWEGFHFPDEVRVLLDLYGTNHDANRWKEPEHFDPERFRRTPPGDFDFIPQGGGQAAAGHRCPGESITISLMKLALHVLTRELHYDVPKQDLAIPRSRLPTLPKSGFVISRIRSR